MRFDPQWMRGKANRARSAVLFRRACNAVGMRAWMTTGGVSFRDALGLSEGPASVLGVSPARLAAGAVRLAWEARNPSRTAVEPTEDD